MKYNNKEQVFENYNPTIRQEKDVIKRDAIEIPIIYWTACAYVCIPLMDFTFLIDELRKVCARFSTNSIYK